MGETAMGGLDAEIWVAAVCIALVAGVIKGTVGFAMPMVLISGLSLFLPADVALAGLIGSAVVTNMVQLLRQGVRQAAASIWRFRLFIGLVMGFIGLSAQLVPLLSSQVLYGAIGITVTAFALVRLMGWGLRSADPARARVLAWILGPVAGFAGGVSGIWGPPTVAYLVVLDLPRNEFMRVQGAVYCLGAVILLGAHTVSGVLNAQTLPLSLALIVPAILGMRVGFVLQDRLDRDVFMRIVLIVMLVGGLNLIRRALMG